MELDVGPTRYWKDGDVIYAENDFIRVAYVASDHPSDIGLHNDMFVTFVNWDIYRMLESKVGQTKVGP